MKKIVLFAFLLITGFYGFCQSDRQVSKFATLGKVWGFLKYYHSSALKGKPDWDKELVRMVPLVEQVSGKHAFDSLMKSWYQMLPAAKTGTEPKNWNADSIARTFSEKNIQQFVISNTLKKEFLKLYNYHLPDTSRYAVRYFQNHLYDHIIHTEDAHESPVYPAKEMRLLALFRYWNTIEYFYPHKGRIDDWDQVLHRYIPRFLNAKDTLEYRLAIRELIHELPDSHSFMQQPGDSYYFYPFRLDYVQGKYIIGKCDSLIASVHDYQLGDEVVAINDKSVAAREVELSKTVTGTNILSRKRNIAQELLKAGDSLVQVTFKRKGQLITKPVALNSWPVYSQLRRAPAPPLWQQMGDNIWYVRFCQVTKPDTLKALFKDIQNAKAVIWDMRDYPNYQVTVQLYQYLFARKTTFTEERNASDFFPGSFIKSPFEFDPPKDSNHLIYTGPMIVLVDEHTQSLSESVAAVLKLRRNTITIGRQTAGTTGNISWMSLPGDIGVSYTGVGVTGLNDGFRQGRGIKVDIPIQLTVKAIERSPDYILQRAIEYARKIK